MHLIYLLLFRGALGLLTEKPASSSTKPKTIRTCQRQGEHCRWIGCEDNLIIPPGSGIGDVFCLPDDEQTYRITTWTKNHWSGKLCGLKELSDPHPGTACCLKHGWTCGSPYDFKALVCRTDEDVTVQWPKAHVRWEMAKNPGNKCFASLASF
ncbi:hypothetical protein CDD80_5811 [Ophiocordyceps camponoti-rufipedis]|uniref:Uncharacterized protein n=1 Tax=Ophiocordyceps camponoti-rufipedis TaxID=2004952 RepID=A0A2C5ZNM4_9HYPO|nr:hypothetical protein CDD80_5811 [Ophiocordyceps camponoti-rufipedis]